MIFTLFIIGSAIGSFLGVCVERLNRGETIIKGRSHCDSCGHTLSWYDLIPLLSFLSLRGRCRYCKKSLSWQLPAIEIVTGMALVYSVSPLFLLFCSLIVIFFSDLKYGIIPDEAIVLGSLSAIFYNFYNVYNFYNDYNLFSAAAAAGFLGIIYLLSRGRGLGFGDVKLGFLMGLFLGWPRIIFALYFSYILGAIIILPLLFLKKKSLRDTISFGPFLIIGTLCAHFLPEPFLTAVTLLLRWW
ncbi:MAG: prepilin peptidase [Patescibacteria group bacterium]